MLYKSFILLLLQKKCDQFSFIISFVLHFFTSYIYPHNYPFLGLYSFVVFLSFHLGWFSCAWETLISILFSADLLVMNSLTFCLSEYSFRLPSFLKNILLIENFMLKHFFSHSFRVFIIFYFDIPYFFWVMCCWFSCYSFRGNDFIPCSFLRFFLFHCFFHQLYS